MPTFLPYPNFIGSAKVLDARRLGKQRVENLQIMQTLLRRRVTNTAKPVETGEFETVYYDRNHEVIALDELDVFDIWFEESVPTKTLIVVPRSDWEIESYDGGLWRNHPAVLMWAGYEHILMFYQSVVCEEWRSRGHKDACQEKTQFVYNYRPPEPAGDMPPWFGDEDFHRSHQSNLLRKHPKYYAQFFPNVPDDLPYVWPV